MVLKAHFATCSTGSKFLIAPGFSVDTLFAAKLQTSLDLVREAAKVYDFEQDSFLSDLRRRGMHPVENNLGGLDYPYAVDGLRLWQAIGEYAQQVVAADYDTEQDMKQDPALMAFWDELATPEPGQPLPASRLRGVPGADRDSRTLQMLADMLQKIIFRAGPYHSAINFSQLDYLSYLPNQPTASRMPFEVDSLQRAGHDAVGALVNHLEPIDPDGQSTVTTVVELTNMQIDSLGHYDAAFELAMATTLPRLQAPVAAFVAQLKDIEADI